MKHSLALYSMLFFFSLFSSSLCIAAATDLPGKKIYNQNCATCHGFAGNGHAPAARALYPKPRDFTRGLFKFRTTPSQSLPTDDDLIRTISVGVIGTSMPAWKDLLTTQQIKDVAIYIKQFAPKTSEETAKPVNIPDALPITNQSIAQGKALYERLQCATCHGAHGQANGPISHLLTDVWGEKIAPIDFTKGYFKSGNTRKDLYRTIITGLDGTPMVAYGSPLTSEEIWSLVDFITSLSAKRTWLDHLIFDNPQQLVKD